MMYDILTQLTKIVLILFIILWTIKNTRNVFIFTCPTLLWSSCKLYLLASSIDNILVIFTTSLSGVLASVFSCDIASLWNLTCKWRYYFGYIFCFFSIFLFWLVLIDIVSLQHWQDIDHEVNENSQNDVSCALPF